MQLEDYIRDPGQLTATDNAAFAMNTSSLFSRLKNFLAAVLQLVISDKSSCRKSNLPEDVELSALSEEFSISLTSSSNLPLDRDAI